MPLFRLTHPALVTVIHRGRAEERITVWGGGSVAQDLLLGRDAVLDYADALDEVTPEQRFGHRTTLTIDRDARRLRLEGDPGGLDEFPPLRRAYARALADAWPGWDVVDAHPPRPRSPEIPMTLLRRLPVSGSTHAVITHVDVDGAVRDVAVGVPVEQALSLGPSLREALSHQPNFERSPEVQLVDDALVTPCLGGALVDDRRGRIELWWSVPTPTRWALTGPLGRLWPDHVVAAHDRGLPHQIATSGRDATEVELSDDQTRALLHRRLFVERFYDPVELRRRVLACVDRLRSVGISIDVPEYARPGPRPTGTHAVENPHTPSSSTSDRPLPSEAPALLRLESKIREFDRTLARGATPPPGAASRVLGPPVWVAIVMLELERRLDTAGAARVARWLVSHLRPRDPLELPVEASDSDVIDRIREALIDRARQAPAFSGLF